MSRRQPKSFSVQQFFKNAAEVWASSPRLRSKSELHNETQQKSKRESEESQLPSKSRGCNENARFQGQLRFQRQAGDVPQPCRTECKWFPKSRIFRNVFHCNCFPETVARCQFSGKVSQGGAVLFAPPRKAVAFLTTLSVCQKDGTGISLPAGSDQGYSP